MSDTRQQKIEFAREQLAAGEMPRSVHAAMVAKFGSGMTMNNIYAIRKGRDVSSSTIRRSAPLSTQQLVELLHDRMCKESMTRLTLTADGKAHIERQASVTLIVGPPPIDNP